MFPHCLRVWEALWDEEDVLSLALAGDELAEAIRKEITYELNKKRRKVQLTPSIRLLIFDAFAQASAEERDQVAEQILVKRQQLDELGHEDSSFLLISPLRQALRLKNFDAIRTHTTALLKTPKRDSFDPEKLVWLALVEFPYAFLISQAPDLVALRILPSFCGGTSNFREHLTEYLSKLSNDWESLSSDFHSWIKEQEKESPLIKIESGTWWARILFDYCSHSEDKMQAAIESAKKMCSPRAFEREMKAYFCGSKC